MCFPTHEDRTGRAQWVVSTDPLPSSRFTLEEPAKRIQAYVPTRRRHVLSVHPPIKGRTSGNPGLTMFDGFWSHDTCEDLRGWTKRKNQASFKISLVFNTVQLHQCSYVYIKNIYNLKILFNWLFIEAEFIRQESLSLTRKKVIYIASQSKFLKIEINDVRRILEHLYSSAIANTSRGRQRYTTCLT